tara:strand:- start:21 stop:416 length:396 start_codon:yes stop_codon:yes gene_type:complete
MIPRGTRYRLAQEIEYPLLDDLIKEEPRLQVHGYAFPTIVAEREDTGEIVGFISTNPRKDMILCEPIIAPNGIVYMRLIEAYQKVVYAGGIRSVFIRVHEDLDKHLRVAKKVPIFEPLDVINGFHWFVRRM